jgi:hypothetical protein
LWRRSRQYLRENWGAPFVLAFILLLLASAVLLSSGNSNSANNIAVYAFYALVLGVVLQIASYVKYGEKEGREPSQNVPASAPVSARWRPGKRILAIAVILIILVAAAAGSLYFAQRTTTTISRATTTSTTSTHTTVGPLSVGIGFVQELSQPNNAVEVLVGVNQSGGLQPFNYTAYWSDSINQSNNVGVFIRSFTSNQSVPSSLKIVVKSSDGQTASIIASVPAVSRSIMSSSTSSTSSLIGLVPQISFIESGLPKGALWSISLQTASFQSNKTTITFNYPVGSSFSYTISGPYDTRSFAWALVPSPQTGTVVVNGSMQFDIIFSNKSITTLTNQIFVPQGSPKAASTGSTSETLGITYENTFPDQVQGIVFATVKNNSTGVVSFVTATINPTASASQTPLLIFQRLSAGNYTASIFVQSQSGITLSQTSTLTFSVLG